MRIYLDSCCLQRPLDDQSLPRIRIETEAVYAILLAVRVSHLRLVGSEALEFEVARNPIKERRDQIFSTLKLASEQMLVTDAVENLALSFERQGIQPMDAVHLALASEAKVDFFCTCDDKLFRRARTLPDLACRITTLLDLVTEITP